jgi:hypothetical protein
VQVILHAFAVLVRAKVFAQQAPPQSSAESTPHRKLKLAVGFRKWVFVGAPLTPNALNGGAANFPEFHHVYVEAKNLDAYLKTGTFPESNGICEGTDTRIAHGPALPYKRRSNEGDASKALGAGGKFCVIRLGASSRGC